MTPDQYRREGAEAMRAYIANYCDPAHLPRSDNPTEFHAGCRHEAIGKFTAIRAIDVDEVLAKVGEVETTAGPWALDTSTGSEILVKGGCSVIEGEDARYLLRLIAADTSTPAPDAVARLVEAARQRDGGTHDPDCKINRTSSPFCCCGHDELMAALAACKEARDD